MVRVIINLLNIPALVIDEIRLTQYELKTLRYFG